MVETEMSLQSDLIKSNNPSQISSYTKIDVDEDTDTNSIPKNDITPPSIDISETNSEIINNTIIINGKTYSVNSDQNRPITHKYFYSKLGNTHTFFGDDKGNPLIIIGPHWPLFALVNLGSTIFFFVVIMLRIGKMDAIDASKRTFFRHDQRQEFYLACVLGVVLNKQTIDVCLLLLNRVD